MSPLSSPYKYLHLPEWVHDLLRSQRPEETPVRRTLRRLGWLFASLVLAGICTWVIGLWQAQRELDRVGRDVSRYIEHAFRAANQRQSPMILEIEYYDKHATIRCLDLQSRLLLPVLRLPSTITTDPDQVRIQSMDPRVGRPLRLNRSYVLLTNRYRQTIGLAIGPNWRITRCPRATCE